MERDAFGFARDVIDSKRRRTIVNKLDLINPGLPTN